MSKRKVGFMAILENYFETYLPYIRGLSLNTINSYKQTFLLLLRFMLEKKNLKAERIQFSDLSYETLLDFFNWLESDRLCKPVTRNQRLSALSAFSEYAQNRDFDAASVFRNAIIRIPLKKCVKKTRAAFTRDEVRILLSLPDETYETGLRDKVLLSFMYATGARAQEVCDLRVRDLRIEKNTASVSLIGKGNKPRQVGITIRLAETLSEYIRHRHIEQLPDRHIFSSQTHEHMTISCIEGIYKKYITIAKNENPNMFLAGSYPPHSMRHSTACHLVEAGVDIVTIKHILGHVSLQTTQIYAEMSQNMVDQKLREWNEIWFSGNKKIEASDYDNYPDFLKKK